MPQFKIGTILNFEDCQYQIIDIEFIDGQKWYLIENNFGSEHWGTEKQLIAKHENCGWGA